MKRGTANALASSTFVAYCGAFIVRGYFVHMNLYIVSPARSERVIEGRKGLVRLFY